MRNIVAYGTAASSASIEQEGTIMGQKERVNKLYDQCFVKEEKLR